MLKFRNYLEDFLMRVYSRLFRIFYKSWGNVLIYPSVRIDNPEYITLESGVKLCRNGWLYAIAPEKDSGIIPEFLIRQETQIADNFHITCANKLTIGKYCITGRNVYISDNLHLYNDTTIPIAHQGIVARETFIDDGCWIGNNAVIVNSIIGKNCVIGANSVVANQYIPDFSVVAGNPAIIVRTIIPHK